MIRKLFLAFAVAVLIVVLCAVGVYLRRVPNAPFRKSGPVITVSDSPLNAGGWVAEDVTRGSIEVHEGPDYAYSLGVVEFTDQGFFWDTLQLKTLETHIRAMGTAKGVVIVGFMHGWNHNAGPHDENLACFRENLKAVAMMQASYHGGRPSDSRRVVGVYLGWRGLALDPAWLNQGLSFWNRLSAADRVGSRGDLLATLLSLRTLRQEIQPTRSKLILVGHSMGARALNAALNPLFMESIRSTAKPAVPPADLVVLVNPAFSASQYRSLAAAGGNATSSAQVPSLVIVSSEADDANRLLYPKALRLASLWEEFATPEERRAEILSVGHFPGLVTHELRADSGASPPVRIPGPPGACPYVRAENLGVVAGAKRVANGTASLRDFRDVRLPAGIAQPMHLRLREVKGGTPNQMLVRVDSLIIRDHNQFYTSPFVEFMSRLVNAAILPPPQ